MQAWKGEPRLFVFGLGYTGIGTASYFQQKGWAVAGTCRNEEKTAALVARGVVAWKWNMEEDYELDLEAAEALRRATHVLSTVPPAWGEDPVVQAHSQLLEDAPGLQWVGYISSTGVYGSHEGAWVDESAELRATNGKGLARILAEHNWISLGCESGLPVHVFRCGGIYGPRRSALEVVQQEGVPSASQQRRARQQYTQRCHVLDICRVLEASMRKPNPTAVYNIVDDEPASRETAVEYAAELLRRREAGLPLWDAATGRPVALASNSSRSSRGGGSSGGGGTGSLALSSSSDLDDPPSSSSSSIYGSSLLQQEQQQQALALGEKRVLNLRIKEELGVRLEFPSYREGLAAIASGDSRPFAG